MTDYRLRLLAQAVTSSLIIISVVVLAIVGSISGSDAMVVLIGTAGLGSAGNLAIGGSNDKRNQPGDGGADGTANNPANR